MSTSDKKRNWSFWESPNSQKADVAPTLDVSTLDRVEKLRVKYFASLPKKLKHLRESWASYSENVSKESLTALYHHCHNINGSAATYGLPDLSEQARNLEQWLRTQMESQEPLKAEDLANASALYYNLEEKLESLIRSSINTPMNATETFGAPVTRDTLPVFMPMADSGTVTPLPIDAVSHGTVLVIEDDPLQAEDIKLKLEQCHFSCRIVHSGAEALKQTSLEKPDLILLDLVMAEMDGFQTLEKLREVSGYELIPVIFLSSIQQEADIVKAYELGANDYLTKPVNPMILAVKLHAEILKFRAAQRADMTPTQLTPGLVLDDRYRIIKQLGMGGMGVVYLVDDQIAGEERALKILNVSPEQQEVEGVRFQREIDAVRTLNHPHLVKLHDAGVSNGMRYYTMSVLTNGDLASLLRKLGAIPIDEALSLVYKVGGALQHIHESGMLHRDLKPENIMFSSDYEPVLTDLGLVIDMEDSHKRLTKTGYVVGTVHYMSPEQILRPQSVDHRIDIYALGVLLFEMVAGFHPFDSMGHMEVMASVLHHGYPSLSDSAPNLPPGLAAICEKALQKDPNDRYETMSQMLEAVQKVRETLPPT